MVGCGRIGERHASLMNYYGELVGVCDVSKIRADEFATRYNVPAFYSLDDFLSSNLKTDVVAVCTPNGIHAEQSIQILKAAMHVLCEKPMAISVLDCKKMIATSKATGKKLLVVKQNRFNPPLIALKTAIEKGEIGEIHDVQVNCFWNRNSEYYKNTWRGTRRLDGGTLYTQFSHFIDVMYWMAGDVKDSRAILRNYMHKGIIEFEDTGVVTFEFMNGAIGTLNYTVNSHVKNMEGSITIFGDKGTVKVGGEYLNTVEYQQVQNTILVSLSKSNEPNDYGLYKGSMNNHYLVYENLVGYLQDNSASYINAEEAMKSVEIIEKIYCTAVRDY